MYYCVDVPDHLGTYWNSIWETVDVKEYYDFDWTLLKFFAGVELEDTKSEAILPGGDRLDIPEIYPEKTTLKVGFAGLFVSLFNNVSNIGKSYQIKFVFQKSGNMRKVTICAGSSSIHQLYTTYADDVTKSAFVANYGYPHVQAIISTNMRKQYEELTGNSRGKCMEDLSQTIQTIIIIVIVIAGAFLTFFLVTALYRGKKTKITIVNKRITDYQGFNTTRSKLTTVKHYTVDCLYSNSSKIHTLRCSFSVYEELKLNKSYVVTVKMLEIIKVH